METEVRNYLLGVCFATGAKRYLSQLVQQHQPIKALA